MVVIMIAPWRPPGRGMAYVPSCHVEKEGPKHEAILLYAIEAPEMTVNISVEPQYPAAC